MRVTSSIGTRLEPGRIPLLEEQVVTLNRELTREVLRHAETRQQAQLLLLFALTRELVDFAPPVRRSVPDALAERTGPAGFIRVPLQLRSGAVLHPDTKRAMRDGRMAHLSDSSWLALSALAERGDYVTVADLSLVIYGNERPFVTVRSAIRRARLSLAAVGATGDIEPSPVAHSGWRLLVAEAQA